MGMGDASAVGGVFVELMSNMAADPTSVARAQIDLFNDSMAVWQSVAEPPSLGRIDEPSTERATNGSNTRTGPITM
jgi:polyhydroxyalkanoate synthase